MAPPLDPAALASICRGAGRIAMEAARGSFESKADGSPVTETDRRVERWIREELSRLTPDIPVIGEESGGTIAAEGPAWVVDPIDGTRAFLAGLPTWCVSIGLLQDGRPVLGCIHLPAHGPEGETFLGGRGVPLTRDGKPAAPMRRDSAVQVCALVPSDAHRRFRLAIPGRIRSLGSTAYHMVLVAAGGTLAAVLHESYPWDVAAALAMLESVDVRAATLDGAPMDLSSHLDGSRIDGPVLVAPRWTWSDVASMIRPVDDDGRPVPPPPVCGR